MFVRKMKRLAHEISTNKNYSGKR